MNQFIDTHTHIYLEEFEHDTDSVIKEALEAGVQHMLMPNVDLNTLDPLLSLWEKYPANCLPMMALHPTSVKPGFERVLEKIRPWFCKKCMVAVGETGIDLYWDKTHLTQQIESFKRHIEWALSYELPLVVHSRNSIHEIMQVLEDYRGSRLKGVMHCFPGDTVQAEWFIDYGFLLGIGGVVSYKKSAMAEVVKHVSMDSIILETDAPYLTPVPHRGKRNQPAYIPLIAQKIAEIKNVSLSDVADQTTANARMLFKIKQ